MSFFELDGGKPKVKKSTKPKAKTTKNAPAKKTSGKKKGGNFLGTVSELFAPAGWENFVTAAGLLALDRTDNYLRKSKDSKKQKGGDSQMEEEMTGGTRKRSSSRKQRGGSDGHHTVETLDMLTASGEEQEMTSPTDTTSQTGGAKSRSKSKGKGKGKVKKGHRGGFMTDDEKKIFLSTYHREPEEAKQLIQIYDNVSLNNALTNNTQSSRANKIISKVIQTHSQSVAPDSEPSVRNSMGTSTETNLSQSMQPQPQNTESSLFGGKKSKSKSKAKKPKPKSKAKKAPKKK